MDPTRQTDSFQLDQLMDDLDSTGAGGGSPSERRRTRYPFRARCRVFYVVPGYSTVRELPGRTRNLSRSGIGLLVRRLFAIGEPVELEILVPNRASTFMAGVVRFCRYAGQGYHELGIELKVCSSTPVFATDLQTAMMRYRWMDHHPSAVTI